ncbi:MAG: hypothetical protein JSS97_15125 [Actinobacteria bacterium]|nr:hypothetical protein [Actinomycetota bacterium]
MTRLRKRLTFSNTIALVALFFALGGSVYAASNKISGAQIKPKSLPGNRLKPQSVTATQIKNGSIGGPQLKAGAVSAGQIATGSITGAQIKAGSISGTQIQSGSLGATQINQTTLTGISAASIHTVQYATATVALVVGAEGGSSGTATCPSGTKVIGGGAATSNARFAEVFESAPNAGQNGWFANGFAGEPGLTMTITAICTPVG